MDSQVTTTAAAQSLNPDTLSRLVVQGDLSKLTEAQKVEYYTSLCHATGLSPVSQPFAYLRLSGKEVLYATKSATDQLRKVYGASVTISARETIGDVYVVTAKASVGSRTDESTGAVSIAGLRGDSLANAFMKAETKAKRRVTLSLFGLGMLDESEIESIPGAQVAPAAPVVVTREVKSEVQPNPETEARKPYFAQIRASGWEKPQLSQYCKAAFDCYSAVFLTLDQLKTLAAVVQSSDYETAMAELKLYKEAPAAAE